MMHQKRAGRVTDALVGLLVDDTIDLVCQYAKQPHLLALHGMACVRYHLPHAGEQPPVLYDPSTDQWEQVDHSQWPDLTEPQGCAVLGDMLHVYALGTASRGQGAQQHVLDMGTGDWTRRPSLPHAVRVQAAAGIIPHMVHVVTSDTLFGFNTVRRRWEKRTKPIFHHYEPGVAVLHEKLYLLSASTGNVGANREMERYDHMTDTWARCAPMLVGRCACAAAASDDAVYACGGITGRGITPTCEVYSPLTDTWSTIADMSMARCSAAAAFVDGVIIVYGGQGSAPSIVTPLVLLSSVERYNPKTDTWTTTAPLPRPMARPLGVVV
jgi:hypothetical protein